MHLGPDLIWVRILVKDTNAATRRAGRDHVQAVVQAAETGRPRRHRRARPLDRDAAAGEESA